ncbi:hypothetical protein D9V37_08245 [Nocardioides mangrovicus]|uniref:L,D-TPase catalytic domain-containing protein n=1 Tax=Nocardioides mangrovicus TaxID=2478913 RepID=A0A3L8P619_9ACTN|nr:L,D-transpeptidase family protein [Nocardioides mangrovicus]RLV49868.1 hypothetical protein D9V37_08245 [Nocardioides mangrovicus]
MRARFVLLLTTLLAVTIAPASAAPALRLDGVAVRLPAGATQVLTVRHTHGYHARATLWQLTDGRWAKVIRSNDARTGYGGLVAGNRRHQGSGTIPLGTFSLASAFGTHEADPAWRLPYRRLTDGDYWVGDNSSAFYNQFRAKSEGGFRWWLPSSDADASEHLIDYASQYEYVVPIGFNAKQVRHKGFAIFLHVNGKGPTAGCVSVPRWMMRSLLARLDPAAKPVIAIGR